MDAIESEVYDWVGIIGFAAYSVCLNSIKCS